MSAEAALSQVSCCDNQTAVLGRGMMMHLKSQPCKHETSITQGLVAGSGKSSGGEAAVAASCVHVLAIFGKMLNGLLPQIAN